MRARGNFDVIAGVVSATGTINAGTDFSVSKTGTGAYTLSFPRFTIVSLTGSPSALDKMGFTWFTDGRVNIWATSTLTLTDAAFSFVAVGYFH